MDALAVVVHSFRSLNPHPLSQGSKPKARLVDVLPCLRGFLAPLIAARSPPNKRFGGARRDAPGASLLGQRRCWLARERRRTKHGRLCTAAPRCVASEIGVRPYFQSGTAHSGADRKAARGGLPLARRRVLALAFSNGGE